MKRRILAVAVSVALALAGCVAIVAYVRGADQRALAGREAAWVLLATRRIPAGTTGESLRGGDWVERVAVPAATVPTDALGELPEDLDTLALSADVQPRQLLLRGMFAESSRLTGGLSLPEGRLAV